VAVVTELALVGLDVWALHPDVAASLASHVVARFAAFNARREGDGARVTREGVAVTALSGYVARVADSRHYFPTSSPSSLKP
jgi:hypothetical protein